MNTEDDPDLERLEQHTSQLLEHFDSIQIFATRHEGEAGTISVSYGGGNWFARCGQVSEWVTKSNERSKEIVRKEEND